MTEERAIKILETCVRGCYTWKGNDYHILFVSTRNMKDIRILHMENIEVRWSKVSYGDYGHGHIPSFWKWFNGKGEGEMNEMASRLPTDSEVSENEVRQLGGFLKPFHEADNKFQWEDLLTPKVLTSADNHPLNAFLA